LIRHEKEWVDIYTGEDFNNDIMEEYFLVKSNIHWIYGEFI